MVAFIGLVVREHMFPQKRRVGEVYPAGVARELDVPRLGRDGNGLARLRRDSHQFRWLWRNRDGFARLDGDRPRLARLERDRNRFARFQRNRDRFTRFQRHRNQVRRDNTQMFLHRLLRVEIEPAARALVQGDGHEGGGRWPRLLHAGLPVHLDSEHDGTTRDLRDDRSGSDLNRPFGALLGWRCIRRPEQRLRLGAFRLGRRPRRGEADHGLEGRWPRQQSALLARWTRFLGSHRNKFGDLLRGLGLLLRGVRGHMGLVLAFLV